MIVDFKNQKEFQIIIIEDYITDDNVKYPFALVDFGVMESDSGDNKFIDRTVILIGEGDRKYTDDEKGSLLKTIPEKLIDMYKMSKEDKFYKTITTLAVKVLK